jgi:hypothetical protein
VEFKAEKCEFFEEGEVGDLFWCVPWCGEMYPSRGEPNLDLLID